MVFPRQKLNFDFKDFTYFFRLFLQRNTKQNSKILFEKSLKAYFQYDNLTVSSSATYSLYLILKFYNINSKKEIFVPSHIYPDFIEVIKLFTKKITFLDIDEKTNGFKKGEIRKVSEESLVLFPLYYGIVPQNTKEELLEIKGKNCVSIIDSAHFFYPNKDISDLADITIYSLSRAKDLDLIKGSVVCGKSKDLIKFIKIEYGKLQNINRLSLFISLLKYFYVYIFTSTLLFKYITFPLLKRSYYKNTKIGETPRLLFDKNLKIDGLIKNQFQLDSAQYLFGIKKLKDVKKDIYGRILNGRKIENILKKIRKDLLIKNYEDNIYYLFPLKSRKNEDLREKLVEEGIDTKEFFLKNIKKSEPFIFMSIPSNKNQELKKFISCLKKAF
ncbi:hypothetical protein C0585_01330 [Candidatus Woesearchaeota archaeon]|nr:MAG: hypothetical protein C0585_01330 [Candidatus Woesearchaeota archaeon]